MCVFHALLFTNFQFASSQDQDNDKTFQYSAGSWDYKNRFPLNWSRILEVKCRLANGFRSSFSLPKTYGEVWVRLWAKILILSIRTDRSAETLPIRNLRSRSCSRSEPLWRPVWCRDTDFWFRLSGWAPWAHCELLARRSPNSRSTVVWTSQHRSVCQESVYEEIVNSLIRDISNLDRYLPTQ